MAPPTARFEPFLGEELAVDGGNAYL